jgi:hypothetical protein
VSRRWRGRRRDIQGAPTSCLRTEEPVRRVVETDQRPLEVINGIARSKSARLDNARCWIQGLGRETPYYLGNLGQVHLLTGR